MNRTHLRNPFIAGPAVSGKNFFGRKQEIRNLYQCLSEKKCCSVIGNRRIGKTSLLKHILLKSTLKCAETELDIDLNAERNLFVLFHTGGIQNEADFWRRLSKKLVKAAEPGLDLFSIQSPNDEDFKKLIMHLNDKRLTVILLFDEFDITHCKMEKSFFGNLKIMYDDFDIVYVTTTSRSMYEYNTKDPSFISPFFLIFRDMHLGLFLEEEAREMLEVLSERGGIPFDEADINYLLQLAGTHPFLLQMAAGELFHLYRVSPEIHNSQKRALYAELKEKLKPQAFPKLQYYFDKLKNNEKKLLINLAKGEDYQKNEEILSSLKNKALIKSFKEKDVPFSKLLKEYILSISRKEEDIMHNFDEYQAKLTGFSNTINKIDEDFKKGWVSETFYYKRRVSLISEHEEIIRKLQNYLESKDAHSVSEVLDKVRQGSKDEKIEDALKEAEKDAHKKSWGNAFRKATEQKRDSIIQFAIEVALKVARALMVL